MKLAVRRGFRPADRGSGIVLHHLRRRLRTCARGPRSTLEVTSFTKSRARASNWAIQHSTKALSVPMRGALSARQHERADAHPCGDHTQCGGQKNIHRPSHCRSVVVARSSAVRLANESNLSNECQPLDHDLAPDVTSGIRSCLRNSWMFSGSGAVRTSSPGPGGLPTVTITRFACCARRNTSTTGLPMRRTERVAADGYRAGHTAAHAGEKAHAGCLARAG